MSAHIEHKLLGCSLQQEYCPTAAAVDGIFCGADRYSHM